jgi:3-deoxy-7-phosphoheptulonate synthase
MDYARKLAALSAEVSDQLFLVMRVYFEKPRTTIGWKGLINDPHLDGTYDVDTGLRIGRRLLLAVNRLGLPAATEFLDPVVPQYLADLISWAAIGARTTESQTHREMASGLSMPVGFKNGTDGSLQIAIDAMLSARHSHHFLGMDQEGVTSVVRTTGNDDGHVVLRGGRARTNFDAASIAEAAAQSVLRFCEAAVMQSVGMADSVRVTTPGVRGVDAAAWRTPAKWTASAVDFGASDMPLTDPEFAKDGLMQFPSVIGGVVPVINVRGISPGQVLLTGQVLGRTV